MKKNTLHLLILCTALLASSCVQIIDLPGGNTGNTGISNDDNKYSELSPRWSFQDLGITSASDIYASKDGRLYIPDSAQNTIHVIRRSGEVESGFYDSLRSIQVNDTEISPTSVCIDSRFMVFFSDGGDKIYSWHQYAALTGVSGVITSRSYSMPDGSVAALSPQDGLSQGLTAIPGSESIDSINVDLDSLTSPLVFYNPNSEANINGITDPVTGNLLTGSVIYSQLNKSYVALADGGEQNLFIYAMDAANNEVLKIRLIPTILIKLKNGQMVWNYEGVLEEFIATAGTGNGTVSDPTGLYTDETGNVYYTQTGNYFSFHKLLSGTYNSPFYINEDDIMGLGEFGYAQDVTSGDGGNIFILDTLDRDVKLYNAAGEFLKSVVVREEWIRRTDTTYIGDSMVVRDTLFIEQYKDLLLNPLGLIYYDDVLYTLNNGHDQILRFTKADDVVVDNPDPDL